MLILNLNKKIFFNKLRSKRNFVIQNLNESNTIYKINKILDEKL